MKHFLSIRWRIVLLTIIPILVSFACISDGSPKGDPTPEAVTAVPTEAVLIDSVSIEADVVFGPGPFNYPDTEQGLSDLTSYKATLIMSFDGTHDGQTQQWSKTYLMLTTKEPSARHLTIEKSGNLSDLDALLIAEVDGAAYEKRGENACNANVIDQENSQIERLDPVGFLNFVIGADEAGGETVNDTAANHYTFDERAFGQLGLAKSTGEIWVASEGGYIVKYLVTTQGTADYFGEGIEGTLTLDYELTDVNQPVTFALPDDCPAGMVDAPLLPDASNILNMPSILEYETTSSVTDAGAFYQEQIPILGWTMIGEPTISDTLVALTYTQGDQKMTIIIRVDAGVTTVNILLGKVQE